eukprot:1059089-Prymnesium_polylepis.1
MMLILPGVNGGYLPVACPEAGITGSVMKSNTSKRAAGCLVGHSHRPLDPVSRPFDEVKHHCLCSSFPHPDSGVLFKPPFDAALLGVQWSCFVYILQPDERGFRRAGRRWHPDK